MLLTLSPPTAGSGLALPEFVALAAESGFSGVEFSINEAAQLVQQRSFASLAEVFESHKVLPAVFGLPVEWRKDEDTFQEELSALPALAKLAQDLDCSRCVTWVLPDDGSPVQEYAATSLRRFAAIAKVLNEQGVRFGLEFIGPAHFRPNPANVWFYDVLGGLDVVSQVEQLSGTQNVGLLVDSWHWYASGGTMMDLASIPVEQVIEVHINDAPLIPREQLIDNQRELPGATGAIDLVGFLTTLANIGVDGPVAVETLSAALSALPPQQAAALAGDATRQVFATAGIEPLHLL